MRHIGYVLALIASMVATSASAGQSYNWTGFSLAVQGDASAFGNSTDAWHYSYSGWSGSGTMTTKMRGGVLGVRAGYDREWNHVVLGIFADINKSWITGSQDITSCPGCGYTDVFDTKIKWFGTAGLTAGVAFDRIMPYGLVGATYGMFSACERFNASSYNSTSCNDYSATGLALGGGIKYAVSDNIILGAEYRKNWLTPLKVTNNDSSGYAYERKVDVNFTSVMGSITWKFSP